MRKIIILTFLLNLSLAAQNIPAPAQSESSNTANMQIEENSKSIRNLHLEIARIDGRISSFDSLINTSLQYLQYSGWVGIALTVFLLIFSVYSTLTVNSEKNKLAEEIKNWKNTLEDDNKIFQIFENSNLKNIVDGLDSSDHMIFGDAIFRASFLTIEGKKKIVPKVKSKIFDQQYRSLMYEIFSFVNTYTSDKKELTEYYSQILSMPNYHDSNISSFKEHIFLTISNNSEIDINLIIKNLSDKTTKLNLTQLLLRITNENKILKFYQDLIINEKEEINEEILKEFLIKIITNKETKKYVKDNFNLISNHKNKTFIGTYIENDEYMQNG